MTYQQHGGIAETFGIIYDSLKSEGLKYTKRHHFWIYFWLDDHFLIFQFFDASIKKWKNEKVKNNCHPTRNKFKNNDFGYALVLQPFIFLTFWRIIFFLWEFDDDRDEPNLPDEGAYFLLSLFPQGGESHQIFDRAYSSQPVEALRQQLIRQINEEVWKKKLHKELKLKVWRRGIYFMMWYFD